MDLDDEIPLQQQQSNVTSAVDVLSEPEDSPARYVDEYGKLTVWAYNHSNRTDDTGLFAYSALDLSKNELLRLLYPVFVHCYMGIVAKGYMMEARKFLNVYRCQHEMIHSQDLQKLEGVRSPSHLMELEFARTLRQSKFNIKMSQHSVELLMQYLRKLNSTIVLGIVNDHINFQVSSRQPILSSDAVPLTESSQDAASQLKRKRNTLGEVIVEKMDLLNINPKANRREPIVLIFVGLAGSGKTSLLQGLLHHIQASKLRGFVVNLDYTVPTLPFGADIDIRDFISYETLLKISRAGPCSAILQSLCLYALQLNERVLPVIKNKADELDYVLVDMPGLDEAFWSPLGDVIVETFASSFPTVVTYVVDANSSANRMLLLRTMLYAHRMSDKLNSPPLIAFNKIDEAQQKIDFQLVKNLISEVAQNIRCVWVSAVTGAGMDTFKNNIQVVAEENMKNYMANFDMIQRNKKRLHVIVSSEVSAIDNFERMLRKRSDFEHLFPPPDKEYISESESESEGEGEYTGNKFYEEE